MTSPGKTLYLLNSALILMNGISKLFSKFLEKILLIELLIFSFP